MAKKKRGVRVIAVINRKGGCGKSSLVRGLASAAVNRGESVTIFDTDKSRGCDQWRERAESFGNWHEKARVIFTLDENEVVSGIDQIHDSELGDHLVLIDTFGGASEALDEIVLKSHLVATPIIPAPGDYTETMNTLIWHERLKQRVSDPSDVPPIRVVISRMPGAPGDIEQQAVDAIIQTMPVIAEPIMIRKAYQRLEAHGLLSEIIEHMPRGGSRAHCEIAMIELTDVLNLLDEVIEGDANG